MEIYVNAKSKKAINEMLAAGEYVAGENYSIFGDGGWYYLNSELPSGTVIKIYDKTVDGTPYAKAYGVWDGNKVK